MVRERARAMVRVFGPGIKEARAPAEEITRRRSTPVGRRARWRTYPPWVLIQR